LSLTAARDACASARRTLARGIHPGALRKAAKQAEVEAVIAAGGTFEANSREWLARREVTEVTANKSRWILATFLSPEVGQ
jgi:hypothetical protein